MSEATTKEAEKEFTIFTKIGDSTGLEKADRFEHQIQLTAQLGANHTCRVRKTTDGDKISYTYTFKTQDNAEGQLAVRQEYNVEVDEAFFNGFKTVADYCQDKTRYFFKAERVTLRYKNSDEETIIDVPDVVYEVDVFKDKDGNICEYAKIDIETDAIMNYLLEHYPDAVKKSEESAMPILITKITHLPFKPSGYFIGGGENQPKVDALYQDCFTTDLRALRANVTNETT